MAEDVNIIGLRMRIQVFLPSSFPIQKKCFFYEMYTDRFAMESGSIKPEPFVGHRNKQNVVKPKSNCWYFSLRSVRETKARALFWLWSLKSFHAVLIYTCIIYTSIYGWLYAGIIYTCGEIITVPFWQFCKTSNESVDALR